MGVETLYIVGLALDYCVFYSAKDAKSLGYTTIVVEDATRGIKQDTISEALQKMKELDISIIKSTDMNDPNQPDGGVFLTSSCSFILLVFILLEYIIK